ncbi:MAG: mechanosensitive ion channel [Alphaproteobacteria bacterium]|nr:mechanosensitive ion channel [Alphaproteobacteria bacterium]
MTKLFKFFLVCFLVVSQLNFAQAQETQKTFDFTQTSNQLSQMEQNLKSGDYKLQTIDENSAFLNNLTSILQSIKKENEKELKTVQKQLEALGAEPEEGTIELDELAKKRQEFKNNLAVLTNKIAETDLLQVKIDELNILILNSRNQKLIGSLVNRQSMFIEPQTFILGIKSLISFFWDIAKSPVVWYNVELNEQAKTYVLSYITPIFFILIVAFWLGLLLKRLILTNLGYRQDIENPRYGQKIMASVFVAVAYGVIPSLIIGSFLLWLIGTKIFTIGFFGRILNSALFYLLYVILAKAIARVTFAPYNEKWRLMNVSTPKATAILKSLNLSIVLIGIVSFFEHIAVNASYPQDLLNILTIIACAVKSFVIVLLVGRIFNQNQDDAKKTAECKPDDESDDEGISSSTKIVLSTAFVCFITFGISIFGYPELSEYILNRIILSAVIFCAFMIIHRLLSEVLRRVLLLGFWGKTFKIRRKVLTKVNFGLNLILNPLIALAFIFTILNLWGLSGDFLIHITKKVLFGFKVGGVEISLIAIVLGIVVFFGSLAIVKMARNHLTNNVFAKLNMDDGIKHSLSSGIGFVGFIMSVLLAIIAMGADLTNLAVIAGALSVGIGFGLQNVINNFVSGIIILFERPFKVGDWVILDNQEGTIKQINIRSTELETFNKTSVIIPNATLLSSSIINMTHDNNWTRKAVKVSVAYGTDVNKVTNILLECAKNNKKILKTPAPYVLFQDFGANSLEFELRCYSKNIWEGWSIPSDLRYEINKRFIEEKIEIPFQQLVIHRGDKVASETQFYAHKEEE